MTFYVVYRCPGTAVPRSIAVEISVPELTVGQNDSFSINVTIGFSKRSADISGTGLWKLILYGSKYPNGTGTKFQPTNQLLSKTQEARSIMSGENVTFFDISGEFEFTAVGCDDEFRFLCFDFMKGDQPDPKFIMESLDEDTSRMNLCTDRCADVKGMFGNIIIMDEFNAEAAD